MASHNGIARCHKASNLAWRRFYLKAVRDFATIIKQELMEVEITAPQHVPGLMNFLDFADTLGLEQSSDEESQEEPSEIRGLYCGIQARSEAGAAKIFICWILARFQDQASIE